MYLVWAHVAMRGREPHAQVVPSVPGRRATKQRACSMDVQPPPRTCKHSNTTTLGADERATRVRSAQRKKSAQVSRQTCSSCAPKHAQISSRAANRHKMNLSNEVQTIDETVTHIRPRSSHPQTEALDSCKSQWPVPNRNGKTMT